MPPDPLSPIPNPTPPGDPNITSVTLEDLIAQAFFGFESADDVSSDFDLQFRTTYDQVLSIFGNPDIVLQNLKRGTVTPDQDRILTKLIAGSGQQYIQQFVQEYALLGWDTPYLDTGDILEADLEGLERIDLVTKHRAYLLFHLLEEFKKYKQDQLLGQSVGNPFDYIREQLELIGGVDEDGNPIFDLDVDYLDTNKAMKQTLLRTMGKFREDSVPASVAPYQCRIGAATFYVPPVNINVSQVFRTGSLTGAAIRQSNTPKFNSGHSETTIEMNLYFPNHETIWGFIGDTAEFNWDPKRNAGSDSGTNFEETNDGVIDYFLSSLRGLVTQFKYAPFLPVRNQYLNQAHDIHAVTLLGMTVSTLPDFPFCLVVNLQMAKFNHKVYLPMLDDFDQAIHWGKFRQFMGKAAARLDSIVNQGFITTQASEGQRQRDADRAEVEWLRAGSPRDWKWPEPTPILGYEGDLVPRFDKVQDIKDGRFFDIYIPSSTPSKIFSPDTTDFRQPGEDAVITRKKWNVILDLIGFQAIDRPQFDFFEFDTAYRDSRYRSERGILQEWLQLQRLSWQQMGRSQLEEYINNQMERAEKSGAVTPSNANAYEAQLRFGWFTEIYAQYLNDPFFQRRVEVEKYRDGQYHINEWKIPMEKVLIDWSSCFVQGVSVSLSNNIARLQVQMQDEPVHQHIGGGDSMVNVSMIVVGEINLIRLRRVFEHIGGLARLEHGHGVLGFLGIKNVVTALCGIKYVLPMGFEVDTIPNYPHAYQVRLSLVDFDVLQQQREALSSKQQKDLIETFGSKRNPFLRIKQKWSAYNAYPDLPLDVRDEEGDIVGHLDPDWYFRSFINTDKDVYDWKVDADLMTRLQAYGLLESKINDTTAENYEAIKELHSVLQKQIREFIDNGIELPAGWSMTDAGKIVSDGTFKYESDGIPLRYYLGTLDEDQDKLYYIEMTKAGAIAMGHQDLKTNQDVPFVDPHTFAESNASVNANTAGVEGSIPLSQYQHEYWNKSDNPTRQFELMVRDWNYRQLDGRMIRAFPTYMLWLIDEGGRFAGIRLFDNFYGLNSVVDFSASLSEDSTEDTLVLRVSNLFQKLTTPYRDALIGQEDSLLETPIGKVISVGENRNRNLLSGLTNELIELNNIRLKPGVRVHLRVGYGSNPNSLQTIFNGTITEVEQGDIMTIIAQSDAVELTAMVNTTNKKGHSGTLDGGLNTGFWMSEPRDLMVRLLSMGSSSFKEWVAWGTKGTIFSENRFGIRHFGSILYEPMTSNEKTNNMKRYVAVANGISRSNIGQGPGQSEFAESLGSLSMDMSNLNFGSFTSIVNGDMVAIMQAMWVNSFKKRDYELFKRNIYPGNGLGIAQYMAGDLIDAGVIIAQATSTINEPPESEVDTGDTDVYKPPTPAEVAELNMAIIDATREGLGFSDEDNTEILELMNNNTFISPNVESYSEANDISDGWGLTDLIGYAGGFIDTVGSALKYVNPAWWTGKALGWVGDQLDIPIVSGLVGFAGDLMTLSADPYGTGKKLLSLPGRLARSPIGRALGFWSVMDDDDLDGYDEVSFRAQTYMKTVWDLFQLCSALLPNYIVAVRPFEDRSTIFYGKPHWLYTSGVIPISNGVRIDSVRPAFEGADAQLEQLKRIASQKLNSFEELQRQLADISALDKRVAQGGNSIYASLVPGFITPEALTSLPVEWDNHAFLPQTEGRASTEMHIPSAKDKKLQYTGNPKPIPFEDEGHIQLVDLPDQYKWPAYMDKAGGLIGGAEGFEAENAKNPNYGQPAAMGLLPPEEEQWYIASYWPYNIDSVLQKLERAGYTEAANKAREFNLKPGDYRAQRVLVYATKTGRAVVCSIGEWGPNPGFRTEETGVPFAAGLSPDTWHTLGIVRGDHIVLRAMPRNTPLGPWQVPAGTDMTVPDTTDPDATVVEPTTGEDIILSGKSYNPTMAWYLATSDRINDRIKALSEQVGSKPELEGELRSYQKAQELLAKDPIVFAYHFGWKFSSVPIHIDVESGLGIDVVGVESRRIYDEDFDANIDVIGDGKSLEEAADIWEDFRAKYRDRFEVRDIYNRVFPTTEAQDKFDQIFDMFLRFMWQVPSRRAWLVNNAQRDDGTLVDQATDLLPGSPWDWDFSNVDPVWQTFLTAHDLSIDENGTPQSPMTTQYMSSHNVDGSSAGNIVTSSLEDIKDWFDDNIGSFIGMVGDTITGFLGLLRMSMMQIGVGLNLAGTMQRQANLLNAVFNDSIYFQEGAEGSLMRMIDNPFTREYGEPVVEIREPFQRMHFLSSFQHILSNNISESLTNVPTVVTATSDGKYPVTVHFDKGMSPERQTEKAVETGLFWDNAVGSGITGMFQPLLHPLEALRSVSKTATGSSDLLSSKRVALWHLKEGLKDIYTGEILILGNPDIRAHDLVYIADVYERMYGMVEVERVVHHFTPENGFVTAITPNAIVTINDPARWSLIAWMWRKMTEHNIRNDTRAMLAVRADRSAALTSSSGLSSDEIPDIYASQLLGAIQYTQGNSALVRDFSALMAMGGMAGLTQADQLTNKVAKMDQKLLIAKAGLPAAGGLAGFLLSGNPVGAAIGLTAGAGIGDLMWKAWGWVKDNLLDQHGCYIQFLNKNGQPMDAGLSYFQGVAVGQHHSIKAFPTILGITMPEEPTIQDGHYRITSNDLLGALGWSEIETAFVHRQTSWFVNQINEEILHVSGRDPDPVTHNKHYSVVAQVLDPSGETVGGDNRIGIIDADTIDVRIISDASGRFAPGAIERVRLLAVNASELLHKQNPDTDYDETDLNQENDLALLGLNYLIAKFTNTINRIVVLRIDPEDMRDHFGRLLAVVFHNTPLGTPVGVSAERRGEILLTLASREPIISWDSYLEDGRPYTLNWEIVMAGYGNVDMRNSLWDSPTRLAQLSDADLGI